jgi:hypothetical protein
MNFNQSLNKKIKFLKSKKFNETQINLVIKLSKNDAKKEIKLISNFDQLEIIG